jgi:anaerobic dimethyl sulfoxide reductase subunit C (anchor subunit)
MNLREWALPVYTILMQLAVGALLVLWVIRLGAGKRFSPEEMDRIIRNPLLVISCTVVAAMVASHFHLSRPFHSFLAVRNFRTSWLSREIVFTLLFLFTLAGTWLLSRFRTQHRRLIGGLGWVAILLGLIVVYCMARIYLLPTQAAWNSTTVLFSFFITAFLLGSLTMACLLVLDMKFAEVQKADDIPLRMDVIQHAMGPLTVAALFLVACSLGITFYQVLLLARGEIISRTSLQLLFELYTPLFWARILFLLAAPVWMANAVHRMQRRLLPLQELLPPVYMSCLIVLVGEIIGRFLFYATHVRVGI